MTGEVIAWVAGIVVMLVAFDLLALLFGVDSRDPVDAPLAERLHWAEWRRDRTTRAGRPARPGLDEDAQPAEVGTW